MISNPSVSGGGGGGSVELVTVQLDAFRQTMTVAYFDGEALKEASSSGSGIKEIQVMKNSIMVIIDGSVYAVTGEIDEIPENDVSKGFFVYGNGYITSY